MGSQDGVTQGNMKEITKSFNQINTLVTEFDQKGTTQPIIVKIILYALGGIVGLLIILFLV